MSDKGTSITVSSRDCEVACCEAIRHHERMAEKEWNEAINKEMAKKPKKFLWWTTFVPASSREEAEKRIRQEAAESLYGSFRLPGNLREFWISEVKEILGMCQRSEFITLSKKDYKSIDYWLPKTNERCYRK